MDIVPVAVIAVLGFGVAVAYYLLQGKSWVKRLKAKVADSFIVRVLLIGLVAIGVWSILDEAGWIPHRGVTAKFIGQNGWMSGEYRDCIAVPTKNGMFTPYRGTLGGFLACDLEGHRNEPLESVTPHQLSITYWGRVERQDMADTKQPTEWRWRCRRNESSVTCWAVN